MKHDKSFDVILAAGGSGSRFGGKKNKLLIDWQENPILWYSLALFASYPGTARIIIPCRPEDREAIEKVADSWRNGHKSPPIELVEGGRQRQDSVYNGLRQCQADWVLIHDGARPFATAAMIEACLEALKDYPAVTAGVLSKDTIKIGNAADEVVETTDRSRTWLIQTPQGFWRKELLAAHEAFRTEPVTDDCSLMEKAGHRVKIVMGAYGNKKITTQEDLL